MKNNLFKFAFVISLLGIFILIVLSDKIEPELSLIEEINVKNIEEFVKIKGEIRNVKNVGNITLLDIKDETGEIKGIIYENEDINESKKVIITGKVIDFEGQLEIEVREIRKN